MIGTRMALALTSHGPMCHPNNSGRVHCLFELLRLHLNYKMGIQGAKLPLHGHLDEGMIYLHLVDFLMINVGRYSIITWDPM